MALDGQIIDSKETTSNKISGNRKLRQKIQLSMTHSSVKIFGLNLKYVPQCEYYLINLISNTKPAITNSYLVY